jgi:hypothetical protein
MLLDAGRVETMDEKEAGGKELNLVEARVAM